VTLSDVNGPKGGEDKRCKVHIALNGKQEIVIDDKQTHFHSAIDLATERASLALTRRIERLRNKARRFKNTFKSNKREKAENNSEYRPENTEDYYGYDYDFGFSPRY
jgi:putative sigma-54 modulation protein